MMTKEIKNESSVNGVLLEALDTFLRNQKESDRSFVFNNKLFNSALVMIFLLKIKRIYFYD